MTTVVYVAKSEAGVNAQPVVDGLQQALATTTSSVGVLRPLGGSGDEAGTTVESWVADSDEALGEVMARAEQLREQHGALVVAGADAEGVLAPVALAANARIAANLNAVAVLAIAGNRDAAEVTTAARIAAAEFARAHVTVVGIVATDVADDQAAAVKAAIADVVPGAAVDVQLADEDGLSAELVEAVTGASSAIRTPQAFEAEMMRKAKADLRTIVLPESGDDRILESASIILERGVAKIVLLGKADVINARAKELGLDVSGAQIVDMDEPQQLEKFAAEYARLRAKKGVTIEQAKEKLTDASYYGTMMVHFGLADGMVSGAINTTANTIRPSLEFIKTKPGIKVVSGAFLMCMPDQVVVYADCAVNPNPTPEQLADIAISSAGTAQAFGIEPRVAMISYSTGTSGSGPDVDAVREATEIAKAARPDLKIDGPIQFDAAVDPTVGAKKMPGSEVAGRATVLVFPDLNTGNAVYKAVQRTSGAVAVGPALQGLNCAVNDLSRGALVDDIVSTVALTAIQAQERPAGTGSPLREQ